MLKHWKQKALEVTETIQYKNMTIRKILSLYCILVKLYSFGIIEILMVYFVVPWEHVK